MNKSDQINDLAVAMAVAQGELENASKNANNPHYKSKYADLAEVLNTVRPCFASHGLSIVQMPSFENGIASVETILMHKSGQWISNVASAPVGKQDAQGVGSVITYLRRYSVAAFAGIAQEDDDANASIGQAKKPQPQAQPEPESAISDTAYQLLCDKWIDSLVCVREALAKNDYSTAKEAWLEVDNDAKAMIWKAPSKGGWFTTREREQMKCNEWSAA